MLFLGTRMGLSIRATGDNPDMVRASSLNPSFTITVGLCLANMLTALSGAIVGQYQKTVDINSGTGIVVIGLACLIIGETLVGKRCSGAEASKRASSPRFSARSFTASSTPSYSTRRSCPSSA